MHVRERQSCAGVRHHGIADDTAPRGCRAAAELPAVLPAASAARLYALKFGWLVRLVGWQARFGALFFWRKLSDQRRDFARIHVQNPRGCISALLPSLNSSQLRASVANWLRSSP
ncbi:hypothetical protein D3C81_1400630 [compost metagenome]